MIITDKAELIGRDIELVRTEDEFVSIVKELEYELSKSSVQGVGLSAPQIGINKAAAIVRIPAGSYGDAVSIDLINPRLVSGEGLVLFDEGCLSFPGLNAKTIRFEQVVIETIANYGDESNIANEGRYAANPNISPALWETRNMLVSDFAAIVCQHEMAHLLNLTMFDFAPEEVGRNDKCPCGSGKKNKRCCGMGYYNENLNKLFVPGYRSV